MIRLLFAIFVVLVALGTAGYLAYSLWMTPERRLVRQFQRMRRLLLDGVDDSERERVQRLLDDCQGYLERLLRARQKVEILDEMADAASDLNVGEKSANVRRLERDVRENMTRFLDEMARISTEVDYDWRQSVERLESFADELEERRRALAELEDMEQLDSRVTDESKVLDIRQDEG